MSKAVLISIKPKWCELIASGEKLVEVRKTKPRLETLFKCYIYQTKMKWLFSLLRKAGFDNLADKLLMGLGKVIGEFVCDQIDEIGYSPEMHGKYISDIDDIHYVSCVDFEQMFDYLADGYGYAWHISDLVIYDKPKELREFITPTDCNSIIAKKMMCNTCCLSAEFCSKKPKRITRPPQSWCYVEEVEDEQREADD